MKKRPLILTSIRSTKLSFRFLSMIILALINNSIHLKLLTKFMFIPVYNILFIIERRILSKIYSQKERAITLFDFFINKSLINSSTIPFYITVVIICLITWIELSFINILIVFNYYNITVKSFYIVLIQFPLTKCKSTIIK